MSRELDVVVVGGGHAGCEAFAAARRVGARAALVTPDPAQVATQPCNPAVGGPGKGHLVREVVALGGLIGGVTDRAGLQFRTLNRRKGPAVRATRVQTDSAVYRSTMLEALKEIDRDAIVIDDAVGLLISGSGPRGRRLLGVRLARGGELRARAAVITAGTFLRGVLYVGNRRTPGGRRGAAPSLALAEALEELGLPLIRLKTGTCPRIAGESVDPSGLEEQPGEVPPPFFDPATRECELPQRICHLTYTGGPSHRVIRRNMTSSALYSGAIGGIGPRYCPSIETKVARFPHRERHQVFLEPEDARGEVIYPSGISTSLPESVQEEMVHAIPGLERARILRYGYAVEYDAVQPTCLGPTLEVDGIDGLFLAGQILGTSGYEEAAALGLAAGANAALEARGEDPLVLSRDRAYTGVMIDDLTGRGVDEPYRMFTSRAEYRLLLREDNADERLVDEGIRTGLIDSERGAEMRSRAARVGEAARRLERTVLNPSEENNCRLAEMGLDPLRKPTPLADLLQRSGVRARDLAPLAPWIADLPREALARAEVDVRYAGYLERQRSRAERLGELDGVRLPPELEFEGIPGLRAEIAEKLARSRPATLGQASRIPGVTPSAIELLHVCCLERNAARDGRVL
ncbi:MAG: tRNA uridine-5-carboxymethylaminomethyl(34) synthesis enzyme MnmG [Polyangia bacterium]